MTTDPYRDDRAAEVFGAMNAELDAIEERREQCAVDRARAVERAVTEYGRGGRDIAAQALGVRVGAVDKLIRQARKADEQPRARNFVRIGDRTMTLPGTHRTEGQ